MLCHNKKASFGLQYASLIICVGLAVAGMSPYVQRSISNNWRLNVDAFGFGRQYVTPGWTDDGYGDKPTPRPYDPGNDGDVDIDTPGDETDVGTRIPKIGVNSLPVTTSENMQGYFRIPSERPLPIEIHVICGPYGPMCPDGNCPPQTSTSGEEFREEIGVDHFVGTEESLTGDDHATDTEIDGGGNEAGGWSETVQGGLLENTAVLEQSISTGLSSANSVTANKGSLDAGAQAGSAQAQFEKQQ